MRYKIPFLFILLISASCVQNRENGATRTFTASSEYGAQTRTSLDGASVLWASGDNISVFNAATPGGETYNIEAADAGKSKASFSGTDIGAAPWFALYPADGAASVSSGVLSIAIPGVQQYAASSFGPGNNPMVAVSSTNTLDFKNLCGLLKLSLTGSGCVRSIVLTTAAEEALWGKAEVPLDYSDAPVLNMVQTPDEEHRSISLDCGSGVNLGDETTAFFFVLPAGTLSSGFSVVITDVDGNTVSRSTSTDLSILRSTIKAMQTVDCSLTGSAFLNITGYGVYDLSAGDPAPLRVFGPDDQLALRTGSTETFRIQSLTDANAVLIAFPNEMTEGGSYSLTVTSVGTTGVTDGVVEAVLLQRKDGVCWLEDKVAKVGYIIASEL